MKRLTPTIIFNDLAARGVSPGPKFSPTVSSWKSYFREMYGAEEPQTRLEESISRCSEYGRDKD